MAAYGVPLSPSDHTYDDDDDEDDQGVSMNLTDNWHEQYAVTMQSNSTSTKRRGNRVITDDEEARGMPARTVSAQSMFDGSSSTMHHDMQIDNDNDHQERSGVISARNGTVVDAHCFSDYNPAFMGQGVIPKIPEFGHNTSTWTSYADCKDIVHGMRPCRTMCWNIPVSVFARHGTRFRHWMTPQKNSLRASHIAAVVSFCFTGTSKGFLSGSHEELQRANGEAESDEGTPEDAAKKKLKRVYRYAFMLPTDNNVTVPMFTIGYEELYDPTLTKVVAIRLYKFVFDKAHSDSELCRRLLDENRDTYLNAGCAHAQNHNRRKNLLTEQKQLRLGSFNCLEYFAGLQYTNIHNESQWLQNLQSYSGKFNVHHNGCPFFDESELPSGIYNKRITPDPVLGGTHPFGIEYVFNARRPCALKAGLVDFEDQKIEVHPDYLDPANYWTDSGEFVVPNASAQNNGFFFVSDSYITNPFDIALPRSIYGSASAGVDLLGLFKERFESDVEAAGGTNAAASDCFNNMMKEQDPQAVEMQRVMAETQTAYDTIDIPHSMRKQDLRHYGDIADDSSYIIEPEQYCKTLQHETRRVLSKVVEPWLQDREQVRAEAYDAMCDKDSVENVTRIEAQTIDRHCKVMKDLVCLHLGRLEEGFNSRLTRETIPSGYLACYDGLLAELAKMPNGTASVAWAHDVNLQFSDMSSFAHTLIWLGEFWEKDTFVEGRDRRILDEMFLHFFEQFGDVTFLLLLCGYKGNGKTLRTERAQAVFPPNWITMGGPASAKAGQNGQSDSTDGKNVIYDEMLEELCDADGSDRLEYWKQIVLKREYTYNRTVAVKSPDGTETHRTMKLRTPHNETHLICTNYGMAFTKDRDPSDTKFAMIDRSIAHLVRSIGKSARTDSEFFAHIGKPEQQKKLTRFRIFVCLVGMTKLAIKGIPAFQPSFALANKLFDYLDQDMVVGEYNLPRCTPRKSLKRDGNLQTMCIMKAVTDVFLMKQTAIEFDAGKLDDDGEPPPFKFEMLYDVIRQLRATPELIFMAWSQSLDYNIGTAAHSMAAMTALCEHFNLNIGDWFKRPFIDKDTDDGDEATGQISQSLAGTSNDAVSPSAVRVPPRNVSSRELETWKANAQIMQNNSENDLLYESGLPRWMSNGGVSKEQRMEMLKMYERQRRATSLYRHSCALDGNTDLEMSNPIETIKKVMSKYGDPDDMDEKDSTTNEEYIPLYPSVILASTVQTCLLYPYSALLNWCKDESASDREIGNVTIGTASDFNFSERKSQGPCKYNTAWLRRDANEGLKGLAKDVANHNKICKMFDLPNNALRDAFYLLTTRDNSRRCTEEPKLPMSMYKTESFKNAEGAFMHTLPSDASKIFMNKTGIRADKKRHPYAMIQESKMQREIDARTTGGRLPAMMPVISNNVRDTAPVRLISDGDKKYIEINTAAAQEHTKMLAEASIRCSVQPGLENLQEAFCGGMQGPDNLCIEGSKTSSKDACTKMPFSFDMVSIALTLDAMRRYYDPNRKDYVKMYNSSFEKLDVNFTVGALPHMCLRFVGYEDSSSRRLISLPVPDARDKAFKAVEVSDECDESDDMSTTYSHLQLSLGHEPSEEEIRRYMKSRAGSRSMSGVEGDLLSMSTYIEHTLVTMKERGMIGGETDIVAMLVQDDPYGLRSRVAEIAGREINELVELNQDMIDARNFVPEDDDISDDQAMLLQKKHVNRVRANLYKWIELPKELDDLRDYAPLNIKSVTTFTFHNKKTTDDAAKKALYELSKKKDKLSDVALFKNAKRLRETSLPGKRDLTDGEAVLACRGRQDSRRRV